MNGKIRLLGVLGTLWSMQAACVQAFVLQPSFSHPRVVATTTHVSMSMAPIAPPLPPPTRMYQTSPYDDWMAGMGVIDTLYLCEENVDLCLNEMVDSMEGRQMFGCHERPASIGVTGRIGLVEVAGPQVTLSLQGCFWHKRETVLGRAASWLHARIPEISDVIVADLTELQDFEVIRDEFSGEILGELDKRSPDYNGDRATMEYQGLDPDIRGPFP